MNKVFLLVLCLFMASCTWYHPHGTGEPAPDGSNQRAVKGGYFGWMYLNFKMAPGEMTKALIVPTNPVGLTLKLGDLMKMANEVYQTL